MGPRIIRLFLILCLGFLDDAVSKVISSIKYDTIVVGLGSSGSTAASTLAKSGKRVLALEAQDRVGGRVYTAPFGDGVVEVGTEWIYGIENSYIQELAINNSITLLPYENNVTVYKSDDTFGPPEKPEPLAMNDRRILKEYYAEEYPGLLNATDYFDAFLNNISIYSQYVTSNNSLAVKNTMSWHKYGYKTFFELLLNTYNNGKGLPNLDIKLNKEVVLIKWPQNSTGDVEVTCKDGEVYKADNVIVTVSIGVLMESYQTLFSPPLPESKVIAMNKILTVDEGKIIFSFSEPWWPQNANFLLQWLKYDKDKYDKWQIKLQYLTSAKGSSNTLTFKISGEDSKLVETLPEEEVKKKCMQVMRMFLGKHFSIPEPTGMIRSMWHSNPFTRGSYSYNYYLYNNNLNEYYPNPPKLLRAPLRDHMGNLRVLFAGEATEESYYGTVNGASTSGYREAIRILSSNIDIKNFKPISIPDSLK